MPIFDYTTIIVNFLPSHSNSSGYFLPINWYQTSLLRFLNTNINNHQILLKKTMNTYLKATKSKRNSFQFVFIVFLIK